jgi:hypothetical protein
MVHACQCVVRGDVACTCMQEINDTLLFRINNPQLHWLSWSIFGRDPLCFKNSNFIILTAVVRYLFYYTPQSFPVLWFAVPTSAANCHFSVALESKKLSMSLTSHLLCVPPILEEITNPRNYCNKSGWNIFWFWGIVIYAHNNRTLT